MCNNSYFIDVGTVSAVVDVQQRLIFLGAKSVAAMAATAATLPTPLSSIASASAAAPQLLPLVIRHMYRV